MEDGVAEFGDELQLVGLADSVKSTDVTGKKLSDVMNLLTRGTRIFFHEVITSTCNAL